MMRLKSLEFLRAGRWPPTHREELGAGVTLVLGDNEAGKSTTRRAIEALLFEPTRPLVAPRTVGGFEFAATIEYAEGQEFRLHRRGKNLVAPAPEPLARLITAELAGRFRDLFTLSLDSLRASDPKFLGAQGALGSLLFGARTGIAPDVLARLIANLDEKIKKAQSGARSSGGLGVRLAAYSEERGKRGNLARFEKYDEAAAVRDAAAIEVKKQTQDLEMLTAEQARLCSLLDGVDTYEEFLRVGEALARLSQPRPPASPDQTSRLVRLRERLKEADDELNHRRANDEAQRRELDLAPEPGVVVGLVEEVESLAAKVERIDGERDSLEQEQEQHAKKARELTFLIEGMGGTVREEVGAAAAALIGLAPVRSALQLLVDREANLAQKRESAVRARSDGERRVSETRSAAEKSPVWSVEPLERAQPYAEKAVRAGEQAREAESELREVDERIEQHAQELGVAHVPQAECAALPRPEPKATRWLEKSLAEARGKVEAISKAASKAKRKQADARDKCDDLRTKLGDIPTEGRIQALRGLREAKWKELAAFWTPAFRAGSEPEVRRVANEFEALMLEVEDLGARRAIAAEASGRLQAAEADVAVQEQEHADTVQAQRESESALQVLEAAWRARWAFVHAPPESASEWLGQHQQWLTALEERTKAASALSAARASLAEQLANARAIAGAELPTLLSVSTAEAVLQELATEEKRRNQANHDSAKRRAAADAAESRLREDEAALARLEQEQAAWQQEWSERCTALPQEIAPEPATVRAWLEKQAELERARRDLADLVAKVEQRRGKIAAFDQLLTALVARARSLELPLPLPEAMSPRDAFLSLHVQTTQARKQREAREKAREQHALVAKELAQATSSFEQRREEFEQAWTSLGEDGAWTEAGLAAARARSAEAEERRKLQAQLDSKLEGSWRSSRDAFIAQLRAQTRVELDGEQQARAQRLIEQKAALEVARRQLHDADAALESLGAAHDALAVEQSFIAARGAVQDKAEELLRLQVARLVVMEARRRASDGGSDLEVRASENFVALTDGAYSGLRIDPGGEAGPSLVAIEASGEEKEQGQLSDGTLDQVWLAVRLAAILQAARETSFPLVLDDVFVQFDDLRSRAALRLLATLSKQLQVIVFTHHDHLVDLAREAIPGQLTVVTLPRMDGTARERILSEHRAAHPRPVTPLAGEEDPSRAGRRDAESAEQLLLALLAASTSPQSKADLLEAAMAHGQDLSSDWGPAIKSLVDSGRAQQEGQKRGARYSLRA
jgi:uncharacterized protein YhaN